MRTPLIIASVLAVSVAVVSLSFDRYQAERQRVLLREVYLEAPASRLSACDASQISGLEPSTCQIILEVLADARFLRRSPEGVFVRRADPPFNPAS